MPVVSNFGGGILTGVDEYYLQPSHSTVLVNANVNRVGLIGINTPEVVQSCQRWFYQYPVEDSSPKEMFITSSDNHRYYTEFRGTLCYSNGGPVCRYTYGEMNTDLTDFKWYDMGIPAPGGTIEARPLVLEDISGASATLEEDVDGFINIEHIKYRIVSVLDGEDTVYMKDFKDNSGEAVVHWVVPSGTKVYRELVNVYDEPVGRYLLVNENGETTFTDGLEHIFYEITCERNSTVDDRASSRMIYYNGDGYTSTYKVSKTIRVETRKVHDPCNPCNDYIVRTNFYTTTCTLTALYRANKDRYVPIQLNISHSVTNKSGHVAAEVSAFMFGGFPYFLFTLGSTTVIYDRQGTAIYTSSSLTLSSDFHKYSTVESGISTYFFSPRTGDVAYFNGTTLKKSYMPKYPKSTPLNTVFSIKDDIVYAIISTSTESNIYSLTLPNMTPSFTAKERIRLDKISSLGATSGSITSDADYVYLPISGKMIRFNPTTRTVKTTALPEIRPNGSTRGFVLEGRDLTSVSENVIAYCEESAKDMPEELEISALNGSLLYNVCQLTAEGLDGPIMDTEHDEVEIENCHMRVDLSGITHTTELRLFRTGGYLTRYTMVEDIDPTDLYIDRRDDVTIALGREGVVEKVEAPPEGLDFLVEHREHLFGAVGHKLYWSEPGQYDYWDSVLNMIELGQDVTGLASGFNGLIIFSRTNIKLLAGSEPRQFSLKTVSSIKGSDQPRGIQAAGGGAMFFSTEGLCFTDGIQVKDLSYDMLGSLDFEVIDSAVTSRSYYALVNNWMDCNNANVILKQDIGKDPMFITLDGDDVNSLGIIDETLGQQSLGKVYKSFTGSNKRKLHYRSGKITIGEPTMIKEWDRVRVTGEFVGLITILVDENLVVSNVLDTTTPYNIHIPKGLNKGKSLTVEIEGSGDVYSIEYSLTGRKTTK